MKIKPIFYILILFIFFYKNISSAETIFFDSKNIKIEENGNMIFATKGVAKIPLKNLIIKGDKFVYDKIRSELTIFDNVMSDIKTPTQGLHEILDNGDVFIEDTDNFRLLRLSNEKKRWEYFNFLGENKIGSIHWSRYLNEDFDLNWIDNINCG